MLALPYKSLDKNTSLFQVGLGASNLVDLDRSASSFIDRVRAQFFFGALQVVFRYVAWMAKARIKDVNELTDKLENINILTVTAKDYKTLRRWRDVVAEHLDRIASTNVDDRYLPKYLQAVMNQYHLAFDRQVKVLDTAFARLDVHPKDIQGFTSQSEADIWNNRAKIYDYLA